VTVIPVAISIVTVIAVAQPCQSSVIRVNGITVTVIVVVTVMVVVTIIITVIAVIITFISAVL
jgi:hypothetical protein